MLFARNSLASLLLIVMFLALISIATILYGSDNQKKADLEQNFIWRQTRLAADWGLAFLTGISRGGLDQDVKRLLAENNQSLGQAESTGGTENTDGTENSESTENSEGVENSKTSSSSPVAAVSNETGTSNQDNSSSSWELVMSDLKNEWDKAKDNPDKIDLSKNSWRNFIGWERHATGADLILRSKNKDVYRLSLPFKFLGK
ncbi:MAG: hypothetical protein WC863_00160 [Patescibacteria group bacterium]